MAWPRWNGVAGYGFAFALLVLVFGDENFRTSGGCGLCGHDAAWFLFDLDVGGLKGAEVVGHGEGLGKSAGCSVSGEAI